MKITINTAKFRPGPNGIRTLKYLGGLIVVFGLAFGVYAYMQWQHTQELLKDPDKREQEEFKAMVTQIGTLIKLPKDETPTLATVSEADRLKNMSFFKEAQNGDRVLMYIKNKKAYLYRPSEKILVEVATINISDTPSPAPGAQVSGAQQKAAANQSKTEPGLDSPASLTIRNGTNTPNLASTTRDSLLSEKYVRVAATEDAANKDYKQSVVVVLNEAYEEHGKALARKYGVVPVIVPPQGETVPQTDLLLILGQ